MRKEGRVGRQGGGGRVITVDMMGSKEGKEIYKKSGKEMQKKKENESVTRSN